MLDLLQEILQYIESEQKFLQELEVVTEASRERYWNIHQKISERIINLLSSVKNEVIVKQESISEDENNDSENEHMDSDFQEVNSSDENMHHSLVSIKELSDVSAYPRNFKCINSASRRTRAASLDGSSYQKVKLHKCKFCKKICRDNGTLKEHLRIHTGEKPFECEICKKRFTTRGNMKKHRRTMHTGKGNFECKMCSKHFANMSDCEAHLRTHNEEFIIKYADKNSAPDTLLPHVEKSSYSSNDCTGDDWDSEWKKGDNFNENKNSAPDTLLPHVEKSSYSSNDSTGDDWDSEWKKGDNFNKENCSDESSYNAHKCQFCEKICRSKCTLIEHLRIHTGEKPFECEICSKRFTTRGNMKKHRRNMHMEERNFKCRMCSENFSNASNYEVHLTLHREELVNEDGQYSQS